MNRRAIRAVLRDRGVIALTVIWPLALAAQWVGDRHVLQITISAAVILGMAVSTYVLAYQRACRDVEHMRRMVDNNRRIAAMLRGEDDPGPAALIQRLDGRHAA